MIRRPRRSPLFPYTTLFRSLRRQIAAEVDAALLDLGSAAAQQLVAREELRLAESELSQARERFKAGVAGNIDVITAQDRKSTRLNSSHPSISYAVFCLKKKK